jgi:hypothetical protein
MPQASSNLASVHCITSDNNVFFELHPSLFFIKDRESRKTLHQGRSKGVLYLLPHCLINSNKQVLSAGKVATSRWHSRLGDPSSSVVRYALSKNSLPSFSDSSHEPICDAYQQAKSHQLPYPTSISVSTTPLELFFSDVWGPACGSIGNNIYYVSFIDDFSKFTWIYLLKHKSEVFQKFKEFQILVERLFDKKILVVQTDWGG